MKKILKVDCPKCETNFNYYESKFRPFCCERCKLIDLGHWFEESYAVASKTPLEEGDLELVLEEIEKQND